MLVQALSWMLAREKQGDALGRGCLHLHPSWLQLVTREGYTFYVDK
jgi:E3 ubiquitin-protein ligase SHPRH